jgi:NAD-dependent dihydropyrimidine dehydrogenase PreA subunit
MTTARDYLASKGLAIAGARGKFSHAAKAELTRALNEGVTFEDWDGNGRVKAVAANPRVRNEPRTITIDGEVFIEPEPAPRTPIPPAPIRREETIIQVIDRFGIKVNLDHCHQCGRCVQKCACRVGPTVGAWLSVDAQSITLV